MVYKQRPVIMTTQDKLKVIAEYDGWVKIGSLHPFKPSLGHQYRKDGLIGVSWLSKMPYLTSLDWLHPVAMKIADVICVSILSSRGSKRIKCKKLIREIESACFCRAVNGEYTTLFNAVYEGIEFLNQNKPKA